MYKITKIVLLKEWYPFLLCDRQGEREEVKEVQSTFWREENLLRFHFSNSGTKLILFDSINLP